MKKIEKKAGLIIGMVLMAAMAPAQSTNEQKDAAPVSSGRETVLDRKVHIEKDWILDIPEVPRYCDTFNLKKQKVNIGDCELYCDEEGSGMPIVFLHGGPGATHDCFHPDLSRATNFARVIYYDQRGCGRSDYKAGDGYSTAQAVDDLEKLRQALKIDQWVVAGHSYGGYVAQHYAVRYPDHLAGLVLISAQPAIAMQLGTRQYDYISKEEQKKIAEAFSAKNLTLPQQLFNAQLNGDWKRQGFYLPTREQLAQGARYGWVHDPQFRATINMAMPDLKGFFDECPIPMLIMEGKWDLTWSADKPAKMQAALPKAQLIVFEKSGHGSFGDEPDLFFAGLKKFILQLKKPADADLAAWKNNNAIAKQSPSYILSEIMSSGGWGLEASKKMAKAYKKEWLEKLNPRTDYSLLLRLGFALYDAKQYEDALAVFKKMNNPVWQGQMLDLLGRREEAVQCYQLALQKKNYGGRHDQYGINVSAYYVRKLIEKPFVRVEYKKNLSPADEPYVMFQALIAQDGWGQEASLKIAKAYKKEWLQQLLDYGISDFLLYRLGFALYDAKMYADALAVFKQTDNPVWQGHMLDLLGKRAEAVECYQKAEKAPLDDRMVSYGLRSPPDYLKLPPGYLKLRIEKPFVRVENNVK